ncbi:Arabinose operon regulatory protein [Rosistilla carotiformis]|uniref:Arabinose operon regulatory protein n=1 Tax=Rosistilla carotiformis TaxID=2528017 RepID=A0A518JWL2_9BACT|nr:helix-turn-helix domain-containing protein [Rosistilla carotiformis]QDV69931.1 Arabinose operon regulatory protein [Rosistilla carotiformis]
MKKQTRPVEVTIPAWGVFVLESHHAADFQMEPSRHPFLEIFHVMQGRGTIRIGKRQVACQADDTVIIPPGDEHSIVDDPQDPLSIYGVCIATQLYAWHDAAAQWCKPGLRSVNKLALPGIRDNLRRMLYEQSVPRRGSELTIAGLAIQLLGTLAGDRGPGSLPAADSPSMHGHAQAVAQYIEQLRAHFFDASDIDSAAQKLGISRRRFTELFRQATGQTWLQFLTDRRVEHACHLLKQTDRTVVSIAFECGFEDLSSFYRAFNRRMHVAPNKWRQR